MAEYITDSDGVKRKITWGKGVAPMMSEKEAEAFHRGGDLIEKAEKRYGKGHTMSKVGEGKPFPKTKY